MLLLFWFLSAVDGDDFNITDWYWLDFSSESLLSYESDLIYSFKLLKLLLFVTYSCDLNLSGVPVV